MSDNAGQSMAHHSWGPWEGCWKCKPECAHCYAIDRFLPRKGMKEGEFRRTTTVWDDPLQWQKNAAKDGVYERVFVCPLSDYFVAEADEWRPEVWEIIRQCPNLVFVLITKRPERIMDHLPPGWPDEFPNVYLGTTAGSKRSLVNMNTLRAIRIHPKATRVVVMEPLLEDIADEVNLDGFGWVLVGGESGPGKEYLWDPNCDWKAELKTASGRRTMKLEWAARVRDKAKECGAAFMFKQVTAPHPAQGMNAFGGQLWHESPPPPLPLPWREQPTIKANHLYAINQLASLDEAGHSTVGRGLEPGGDEPKLDNLSNLQAELAVIEGEITAGKDRRALTSSERAVLERQREAVVACFRSSRYERGKLLSEYRESFRKSSRTWMKAAKAIADAEGINSKTIQRYIKDYRAAASLPAPVRAALKDKGIDAAKRKNRALVERIRNQLRSEPVEPDKERARQIVADEVMKSPVTPGPSSEPLAAGEKQQHLVRQGIRKGLVNVPVPERLGIIKAVIEEEMWAWGVKESVTITLTPHWTAITFDGRKLKSDDCTQEMAA